jgi:hypothetical protein
VNSVFSSLITPAFVATIISLLLNARTLKRKDIRDAYSKRIEEARYLIGNAVNAASEYFSLDFDERLPKIEAKLWMAEREVRLGLFSLTEIDEAGLDDELAKLRRDFDFFITELTSGNFQRRGALADLAHIRKIAGLGAELRQSISRANENELRKRLDDDLLSKIMKILQMRPYFSSIN